MLTGASGAVGEETLKELVSRRDRYHIVAFDLKNKNTERILRPFAKHIEIVWGDITNRATVDALVKGVDFVIHLAAVIPPLADFDTELAERVNLGGTRNLIEALERYAPEAFLLYSSSVSVYGDRVIEPWLQVSDPLMPSVGDYYAHTKIAAEKLIRASNLHWSIFRFSAIMGPRTQMDPLFFHMPLNTCIELATTRDTGYALVEAIAKTEAIQGRIFNLAGGEKCRVIYKDMLTRSFEMMGLGELDFPEGAFAERNFHCGNYLDSDELNDILHFQRDSLEDYYQLLMRDNTPFKRFLIRLMSKSIKKRLLRDSDPYMALRAGDEALIERFFNPKVED